MLVRSIATTILAFTIATPFAAAQSGSRGSVPSPSRVTQPIAPQVRSNVAPSIIQSSPFDQGSPLGLTSPLGEASPLDQPVLTDPSMPTMAAETPANGSTGSSSLGIPAASVNDPIWTINDPASTHFVDHNYLDCFLRRYVITDSHGLNRVDYKRVSAIDCRGLRNYLSYLQAIDVRTLNRDEQLAFWFNLYNARVIALILDNYPLNSIRKIKSNLLDLIGPFDDETLCVLGKKLTLNDVESGIIRPIWNDPRIHYAVNCGSYGCPNLARCAWRAANIDARLNSAAYQFINSNRAIRVGLFGHVRLSKIWKWYADDFGGTDQAVLNHIRSFANAETCRKLANAESIKGYFYDWSLNDAKTLRGPLLERLIR